jgi:hypothetical protein
MHCQNEYDAKDLLNKVSLAIDQGKEYEQEKMKYISTLAVDVFGLFRINNQKFIVFSFFFQDLMKVIIE